MPSAKLTSKGQITLPKAVREHLRVSKGGRVDFRIDAEGHVELVRAGVSVAALRGLLKRGRRAPVSVEAMDAAIARVHGKR